MTSFTPTDDFPSADAQRPHGAPPDLADAFLSDRASTPQDRVALLQQLLGEDVCSRLGIFRIPDNFLLSVVVPVYNEAATVERAVDRVLGVGIPCEVVIVDDGSSDGTRDCLDRIRQANGPRGSRVKVFRHEANRGKGAALRTGFAHVRGDVVVIQDADLEYHPSDFRLMLQPILAGRADVVYGSRFRAGAGRAVSPLWHAAANRFITTLTNVATGLKFTDVETCYKMMRREVLEQVSPTLSETGFGIEIEITAKLAKLGVQFFEQPISYARRSYDDGKKITWRDALRALWCIVKYR